VLGSSDQPSQDLLGLVDLRGKVIRSAAVGMEALHESPVSAADLICTRIRSQSKDRTCLVSMHLLYRCSLSLGPLLAWRPPRLSTALVLQVDLQRLGRLGVACIAGVEQLHEVPGRDLIQRLTLA
jgi:hypothetical protein